MKYRIGPLAIMVAASFVLPFTGCAPSQKRVELSDEARAYPGPERDYLEDEHNAYGYPEEGTLLRRIGYTVGHDGELRVPLWVSYHLTADYVDGTEFIPRENIGWKPDPDLPAEERAVDKDYRTSGYSRGHMAMQSDLRDRSKECERQGKWLSNAVPQKQPHNGGIWLDLENQCKNWARHFGEIWIICGPIFDDDDPARLQGKSKDRVAIPNRFYKIVVRETSSGPEVLGFVMVHEPWPEKGTPLDEFFTSVDDIETSTGLDFLADLEDDVEDAIEAVEPAELWPDE